MAINIPIRWAHPSAVAVQVKYARVDNVTTPVYTTITPNPPITPTPTPYVIQNLPNGQYEVQATPIYADGRNCTSYSFYTDPCDGIISIDAYINNGNVIVTWTAQPYIPKARITVNFPSGGSSQANYSNTQVQNVTAIPIPPGNSGNIFVFAQSVCDETTQFYSAPSNQVSVFNNAGVNPIPGQYKIMNSIDLICNAPVLTLYTNGAFGIGKIVYNDNLLTVPNTGSPYIADATSGKIYTKSTTTGEVLSDTGQYCSVLISNGILTDNYRINSITGIPGFTMPGGGLLPGTDYVGTRTPAGTLTIGVNVTSNSGAFGKLTLYKNNSAVDCINVSGNNTYTFDPVSVIATDLLEIQSDTGSC